MQAGEEEAAGVVPVTEAPDQRVQRLPDQPVQGPGHTTAPRDPAAHPVPDVCRQPAQPDVSSQRHRPPAPDTDGEQLTWHWEILSEKNIFRYLTSL